MQMKAKGFSFFFLFLFLLEFIVLNCLDILFLSVFSIFRFCCCFSQIKSACHIKHTIFNCFSSFGIHSSWQLLQWLSNNINSLEIIFVFFVFVFGFYGNAVINCDALIELKKYSFTSRISKFYDSTIKFRNFSVSLSLIDAA